MRELSKSIIRRMHDPYFINKFFVGNGIDIGGKPDPLHLYKHVFPLMKDVLVWDWEQGDAQFMQSVSEESFDFVHSSHCLEHLIDPIEGLSNWFRILRTNGFLIVVVPEEDLYEQGIFPSTFNKDHKWTFSINKSYSWSQKSINILQMIQKLGPSAEIIAIKKLFIGNRIDIPRYDQTRIPIAESAIEFVLRKRSIGESQKGMPEKTHEEIPLSDIPYLQQYKIDQEAIIRNNKETDPFTSKEFRPEV